MATHYDALRASSPQIETIGDQYMKRTGKRGPSLEHTTLTIDDDIPDLVSTRKLKYEIIRDARDLAEQDADYSFFVLVYFVDFSREVKWASDNKLPFNSDELMGLRTRLAVGHCEIAILPEYPRTREDRQAFMRDFKPTHSTPAKALRVNRTKGLAYMERTWAQKDWFVAMIPCTIGQLRAIDAMLNILKTREFDMRSLVWGALNELHIGFLFNWLRNSDKKIVCVYSVMTALAILGLHIGSARDQTLPADLLAMLHAPKVRETFKIRFFHMQWSHNLEVQHQRELWLKKVAEEQMQENLIKRVFNAIVRRPKKLDLGNFLDSIDEGGSALPVFDRHTLKHTVHTPSDDFA